MGIIVPSQKKKTEQACEGLLGQPVEVEWVSLTNRNKPSVNVRKVLAPSTPGAVIDSREGGVRKAWKATERHNKQKVYRTAFYAQAMFVLLWQGGGGRASVGHLKMASGLVKEFAIHYPPSLFNEFEKHLMEGCRCRCDGEKGCYSCSVLWNWIQRGERITAERRERFLRAKKKNTEMTVGAFFASAGWQTVKQNRNGTVSSDFKVFF